MHVTVTHAKQHVTVTVLLCMGHGHAKQFHLNWHQAQHPSNNFI